MSSTPQFDTGQLAAARAKAWHQAGEPLLTLDAARTWITETGILLFAPRPQHVTAPAPSLIEATLGEANEAPSAAQTGIARSFVARLVSEGNALPLNLLGGPGDAPDFIVSAQIFSFIFTLCGDKLWKQAPSTSGSVKVSPLALAVYEALAARGALTAAELASELGREVTEAAILRSLNELWTLLRVIPLLQQGEAATMWELTSRRFTKTIKAGINAGQPTALSALVSLYLSQALLATEEEISAFLSPLAPRSRIREVIHGLTAGRQLEPIVLEGKTLLHLPGTLPEFPAAEVEAVAEGDEPTTEASEAEGEERIKRFTRSADDASLSDFKGKPVARTFAGMRDRAPRTGAPSRFGDKPERTDRERRPFRRDAAGASAEKPTFSRPWDEDRKPRSESPSGEGESAAPAKRPYKRAGSPSGGFEKREGFSKRPSFGARSGSSDRGPARKSFGDKPPFRKDRGEGFAARPSFPRDGERKPFVKREGSDAEARPRRTFSDRGDRKPGGFGEKRPYVRRDSADGERPAFKPRSYEGGAPKRPYVRRDGAEGGRPAYGARSDSAPKRPYVRRDSGDGARPSYGARSNDGAPKRPYVRRDAGAGERPSYGARSNDGAPKRPYVRRDDAAGGSRPPRPSFDRGDRKPDGFAPKRPYVRRDSGDGERPARPSFGGGDRPARPSFGAKRTFGDRPKPPFRSAGGDGPKPRTFGDRTPRGDRPSGPSRGGFGAKPAGRSFGSRPGGKVPFGGKPAFGKRPAGDETSTTPRKPRRKETKE